MNMKRLGIIAIVGMLALSFTASDALAGGRGGGRGFRGGGHRGGGHRGFRGHRSFRRGRHFRSSFYFGFPYYAFGFPYYGYRSCYGCGYVYGPRERVYVTQEPANEFFGTVLGAIGGGVIGHQIGRGGGRAAATVAGVLIGSLVGKGIGRQIDQGNRLRLAKATQYALEKKRSGTETTWRDPDSGAQGSVVPRSAWKNAQGQYCREFQQTIIISGKRQNAYGTACRQPGGQWKIVNTAN